jgi:hypothetical protein
MSYCPICKRHKIVFRKMCVQCEARGGRPFLLRDYLAGRYSVESKLKDTETSESGPEPRFRCTNVFEDDGTRCRRARERLKRYCERCRKMRRRASTRQAVQRKRVRCKQNACVSASA